MCSTDRVDGLDETGVVSPKAIAESIVGPIEWDTMVGGFCRCPGEGRHTAPTGARDCRVRIDGVPTIFCFHANCAEAVQGANVELRRRLGETAWTLRLPDGRVLQSGERLGGARRAGRLRRAESRLLEEIAKEMEARQEDILDEYYWPYEEIVEESPLAVAWREPEEQFRLWLKLWPPHATIWIGDVFQSGPEHASHFRPVPDWYQVGPAMGNFTCPSSFHPGSSSRCGEAVEERRFLVVESDTLSRDEVGAVFMWMVLELRYELKCIVDTGGKSLHAWFTPPRPRHEARLKAALTGLGCDPRMFGRSQPVRVPGVYREKNLQRLLWLC